MSSPSKASAEAGAVTPVHGSASPVPVQTRDERFSSFEVADFAPVTGREVDWKLTPTSALSDLLGELVNGERLALETTIVGSTQLSWVPMSDSSVGSVGRPEDRASAIAWASTSEALLVDVHADDVSEVTISRSSLTPVPNSSHTVIRVAPFAKATVVLTGEGQSSLTENVEILAGESSQVTVITLQEWASDARHLASHFVRTEKNASVTHVVVSLSGSIVRVNPQTHLAGEGSRVNMLGLYFADSGEHLEQQVFVHHEAPHTTSRVNYKGALQGAGARTVWIGDVLIGQSAVGTDSYEQNRNLVLTEGTRADSIPNLEIKTGDIAGAGHASATGRFDDEQLFYLQARGIDEATARQLVVRGFLNEIVQQIPVESVAARIEAALDRELEGIA